MANKEQKLTDNAGAERGVVCTPRGPEPSEFLQ